MQNPDCCRDSIGGRYISFGKPHLRHRLHIDLNIMSDNCDALSAAPEEAGDATVGVHFIHLEEVMDVSEEWQDANERQELRRRLREAATRCRQKRENHDRLLEHGLDLEAEINETEAENNYLTGKVKELKQQMDNIRKRREKEEEEEEEEEEGEEALQQELLSEEENWERWNHLTHNIRKMEKENENLLEKIKDLPAEEYQGQIQLLGTAEQEYKQNLEQVQEVLRRKDDEIEQKSMTLVQFNNTVEESLNSIKKLKQDQQKLRKQLSRRQEEQILAAWNTSTMVVVSEEPVGRIKGRRMHPLLCPSFWRYPCLHGACLQLPRS
ncbi:huntingtin-associated protein 1 isoform X2 [Etheostoma spectabile]|uniref:huntingtin-associated protein 1 isoform X2 n=1 Tax=Etheostoma spectabile TaxID=54343 RepID=UPI0013AF6816|nr:huntingtin-associated protein 1-like isoform X2 [Etheostoma spectabile]